MTTLMKTMLRTIPADERERLIRLGLENNSRWPYDIDCAFNHEAGTVDVKLTHVYYVYTTYVNGDAETFYYCPDAYGYMTEEQARANLDETLKKEGGTYGMVERSVETIEGVGIDQKELLAILLDNDGDKLFSYLPSETYDYVAVHEQGLYPFPPEGGNPL